MRRNCYALTCACACLWAILPACGATQTNSLSTTNSSTSPRTQTLPLRTLAKGAFSSFTEPKQEVIKDKAAFLDAWSKCSRPDDTKAPAVDFDKEMVVLAGMGQQRTGGYSVEITKVAPSGDRLLISVRKKEPKPGGIAVQALTNPFHLVAVAKSSLKPQFVIE